MASLDELPPPISKYVCFNNSTGTTIFPAVWNSTQPNPIWVDHEHPVLAGGKSNPIDLTTVYPSIPDQTTIFLGCTILHVSTPQKDAKNPKTFTTGSSNTAKGAFNGEGADGRFYVDPGPNVMNALQASDLRLTDTTPAVAKLLVALANLIAPEVTV